MKKIIFLIFLLFCVLGFSRFIKECEITSIDTYNKGKEYVNCLSLESGKYLILQVSVTLKD